jgi:hypothetical protein
VNYGLNARPKRRTDSKKGLQESDGIGIHNAMYDTARHGDGLDNTGWDTLEKEKEIDWDRITPIKEDRKRKRKPTNQSNDG